MEQTITATAFPPCGKNGLAWALKNWFGTRAEENKDHANRVYRKVLPCVNFFFSFWLGGGEGGVSNWSGWLGKKIYFWVGEGKKKKDPFGLMTGIMKFLAMNCRDMWGINQHIQQKKKKNHYAEVDKRNSGCHEDFLAEKKEGVQALDIRESPPFPKFN